MTDVEILTGIIQAIIIVIPVWITISVYMLKRVPLPYDKFGVVVASILSIGFWQIIRMMNIITGYISPTEAGSPGDASIRLILRLDEFLLISWFLIIFVIYLSVSDNILELFSYISGYNKNNTYVKLIVVIIGSFIWMGLIFLISVVLSTLGGIIV